ncbi:MAG TPA: hypothetical protein VFN35_00420 [Ktedonobacteraceae bacterium]|nr:hypothetical protein [Ktedonobacteraceae bacterium]
MLARRKLFRTQALKHYAKNRQKDILPGFVTPPVFLCLWFLVLIIGAATFLAWQERIPTYSQAPGVILVQQNEPAALLFVPADAATGITIGQELILQVNATGQHIQARIASVDPDLITPEAARAQYGLTGDTQFIITQPSSVVHINLSPAQASQLVDQLSITAQIQTGARSLLSMLPALFKNAFGG